MEASYRELYPLQILKVFKEYYQSHLGWLERQRESLAELEKVENEAKKRLQDDINTWQEQLSNPKLSPKARKELLHLINARKQLIEIIYPKTPLKNKLPWPKRATSAQIVNEKSKNESLNRMLDESITIKLKFNLLAETITKELNLGIEDDAKIHALFVMWGPHQKRTEKPFNLDDEVAKVLFDLRSRKSPASMELKQILKIRPFLKYFLSKQGALKEKNAEEIIARGEPYWTLTENAREFHATVKQILDRFAKLRPFISEELSEKVAMELMKLLADRGLKKVFILPAFYADIRLRSNLPMRMRGYEKKDLYLKSFPYGETGRITQSDLLDFSIIILDEIYREHKVTRGQDVQIMKLINAMSGPGAVIEKQSNIASRRRDLWKKPKWRQMQKMRESKLEKLE